MKKRNKYTEEQLDKIADIYKNTYKFSDAILKIEEKTGFILSASALRTIVSRLGVKKSVTAYTVQSTLTLEEIQELISEYESGKYSLKYLRDKYNFKTDKSIHDKVRQYGGKVRTSSETKNLQKPYNEDMFERVDESWKAYFLGLLLTDGYIVDNAVGLDLVDLDVIEYLSEKTCKNYTTIVDKRNSTHRDKYRLYFRSDKMVIDLKRLSVIRNKSRIIIKPNLYEDELTFLPEVMQGIIDGDGWIRKDGKEFFVTSASADFIQWVKEVLEYFGMKDLRIKTKSLNSINPKWADVYEVRTAIQSNINILKTAIYRNNIGMCRKHRKLFQNGVQRL